MVSHLTLILIIFSKPIFDRCLFIVVLIRRSIISAFVENASSGWLPRQCPIRSAIRVKSSLGLVRVLIFGIPFDNFMELVHSKLLSENVRIDLQRGLPQSIFLMFRHCIDALEKAREHLVEVMLQFNELSFEIRCCLFAVIL